MTQQSDNLGHIKQKKDNIQSMKFCHEVVFVQCPFSETMRSIGASGLAQWTHIILVVDQPEHWNTKIHETGCKQKTNALHGPWDLGEGRVDTTVTVSYKDMLCSFKKKNLSSLWKKDDVFILYPLELFERFSKLFISHSRQTFPNCVCRWWRLNLSPWEVTWVLLVTP